jgi:hypothetical protein
MPLPLAIVSTSGQLAGNLEVRFALLVAATREKRTQSSKPSDVLRPTLIRSDYAGQVLRGVFD